MACLAVIHLGKSEPTLRKFVDRGYFGYRVTSKDIGRYQNLVFFPECLLIPFDQVKVINRKISFPFNSEKMNALCDICKKTHTFIKILEHCSTSSNEVRVKAKISCIPSEFLGSHTSKIHVCFVRLHYSGDYNNSCLSGYTEWTYHHGKTGRNHPIFLEENKCLPISFYSPTFPLESSSPPFPLYTDNNQDFNEGVIEKIHELACKDSNYAEFPCEKVFEELCKLTCRPKIEVIDKGLKDTAMSIWSGSLEFECTQRTERKIYYRKAAKEFSVLVGIASFFIYLYLCIYNCGISNCPF